MRLHDAHNHLQHPRLASHLDAAIHELSQLPFDRAVVNGSKEDDWPEVRRLAARYPWVVPSYGIHPWYVDQLSESWEPKLRDYLTQDPASGVGEIGLDRWIAGHDLAVQTPIFRTQLALATELNRAATLHCVRAWGTLWDVIREASLPARGFLLHAYGGPEEMAAGFLDQGAYFSFSPYFLHERKAAQRQVFQHLPLNRILVETDAPDMAPPRERARIIIEDDSGALVNHPANIVLAYEALAEVRGIAVEELAAAVDENFRRLFL